MELTAVCVPHLQGDMAGTGYVQLVSPAFTGGKVKYIAPLKMEAHFTHTHRYMHSHDQHMCLLVIILTSPC